MQRVWRNRRRASRNRIDSRFLLPEPSRLPQINCYPASAQVRGGGGDGEATEHGDTAGIETGSWERRQILDEFTRVTG
jgi:hypothetical protein